MRLIKLIAYILVFMTPLMFVSGTEEAFEFPKMILVYVVATTLVFLYILLAIWARRAIMRPTPIVLVFVGSQLISAILSSHLYTSIWGYYSRFNGGIASAVAFVAIYFVLINIRNRNFLDDLLNVSIVSSLPITAYAIVQHFTFAPNSRIYSTFGQPNWLGAFLVVNMILVLYRTLQTNETKNKVWLSLVFVLGYAGCWYTYSLSSLLGLLIGTGLLLLIEKKSCIKNVKVLAGIGVLALVISLSQPGIFGQRLKDIVIDIRKVQAQTETTKQEQVSDPGFIRLYVWKGTLNLIFSSPKIFLIGTGQETFPYEFQPFRPTELNYSSEWDYILNKPHNHFLETWAEEGLLGLLVYFGILWKLLKNARNDLKAATVSIIVTSFFGWPTVSISLLVWVFVAHTITNKSLT